MKRKSILVTGANGLIGFDVVKRLVSEGRQVIAVDRTVNEVRQVTDHAYELEIGDVHKLHEFAERFEIDAIVHGGGFSGPSVGRDNPALMFKVNVGGAVDVCEVARQFAARGKPCRVVFCSSLTVYGNQPADDITEDFPLLARQCYPSSKIAGEAIVASYIEEHGVDAVSLRIAGVYGPRRRTSCALRRMISDALAGRPTHLPFGKGFPRQWVHVDDIVEGVIRALDASPTSRVFNLSGGINPMMDEAAAIIGKLIPSARIALDAGADPEDITLGRLSIEAARRELGFEPRVSLADGIARLVEHMRNSQIPPAN